MKPRTFSLPAPFSLFFTTLLTIGLSAGCGDSQNKPATNAVINPPQAKVEGPGKDQKVCFQCSGQGKVACTAPGCKDGKVDCPGPCLKLSKGNWIHMTVAGHDPSELWMKFPNAGGKGGYQAWNQHHVGEVIAYQNGQAVNMGPCKICGGTTKVPCKVCNGQGTQTCPICNGQKFIPIAWTETDNPWLNKQPDLIRLKDGRVLLGKVMNSSGQDRIIKTRDGKTTHVDASDIVTSTPSNFPVSTATPSKP